MAPEKAYPLRHGAKLVVKMGDITKEDVDAIVNAANERMLGGGGVDGAIHRAAGPQLVRACAKVPEVSPGVRCPTGEARITPGFDLPARHVIHTVGPIYANDEESAPLLAGAYRSSMRLALADGLASVSFPGISTGVFGYPFDKAAQIAVSTVDDALSEAGDGASVKEVRFVIFNRPLYDEFVAAAQKLAAAAAASPAASGGAAAASGEAAAPAASGGAPAPSVSGGAGAAAPAASGEAAVPTVSGGGGGSTAPAASTGGASGAGGDAAPAPASGGSEGAAAAAAAPGGGEQEAASREKAEL